MRFLPPRLHSLLLPLVASTSLAALVSCGGAQQHAQTPANVPAGTPWASLTHEQRLAVMKTEVKPRMKALFQAYDPVKFKDFTCMTCHGDRIMDGDFTMPNPKLPALPDTPDGFKALMAQKPAAVKFMMHTVTPTMVKLLVVQPYDPRTGKGFGCFACHTAQK